VGWRWEGVAVAALLDGEVEGDEVAGESFGQRGTSGRSPSVGGCSRGEREGDLERRGGRRKL
jgi:hypothetical protein